MTTVPLVKSIAQAFAARIDRKFCIFTSHSTNDLAGPFRELVAKRFPEKDRFGCCYRARPRKIILNDLLILGAGGSSREIADAVKDINRQQPRWNLLGFLDDDPAKQGTVIDGAPVLGRLVSVAGYTAQLIIGIARSRNPGIRRLIVERLGLHQDRYATIVHPSASISPHASIGAGTAVLQNVVVTAGTNIGSHVLISQNVTMAHDQVVEDFVTIASGATIAGFVRLRTGSYIGAGAVINDGITVNEEALAGIGSVVLRNVPARRTVFGNPAQLLPELQRH